MIANSYGLSLVGYEGGQSLVNVGDATTSPLYIAANRDSRMGISTATYLQDWQQSSYGALLSYYNDIDPFSIFGSWGALENVTATTTPKYNALTNFVSTAPLSFDTTPPSTPTNVTATAVSSSAINLSWTASTDNVGVQGYRVLRNGSQVGSTVSTSYGDTGLTASTNYSYTAVAYDAAGNDSAQSSSASATTVASGLNPTFIATGSFVHSGSTETGTAANLGVASSTRFVIVPIVIPVCSGRTIATSTINGVPATVNYVVNEDGVECLGFVSAQVTSGSSGNIVLNMSDTMFGDGTYAVYTIDGSLLSSTTPTVGSANTAGGTSESPSVSAMNGGFILGSYTFGNGSSGKNVSVSGGFTSDDETDARGFFHFGSVAAGTTSPMISWTGTYSSQSALAAWR